MKYHFQCYKKENIEAMRGLSKRLMCTIVIIVSMVSVYDLTIAYDETSYAQEMTILDWDKLRIAVKTYDQNPTDDNARSILEIIPEKIPSKQIGNDEKALIYLIHESPRFTIQVEAGNEYLAEAAFRLYLIVDPGGALQGLGVSLSRMLIKKPELYLGLLKKYKAQFPSHLEYPLLYTTYEDAVPDLIYDSDEIGKIINIIKIYDQRLRALYKVVKPDYLDLRNECIKILEKEIHMLKEKTKK